MSTSFPFLKIAREHGLDYGEFIRAVHSYQTTGHPCRPRWPKQVYLDMYRAHADEFYRREHAEEIQKAEARCRLVDVYRYEDAAVQARAVKQAEGRLRAAKERFEAWEARRR